MSEPRKPEPSRLTPRGNRLKLVRGNGKRGSQKQDAARAKGVLLSQKSKVVVAQEGK